MGEEVKADRLDLYLQAFADLPILQLENALEWWMLNCRWFPKVAEIREIVIGAQPNGKQLANIEAELAWERVLGFVEMWHPDIGPFKGAPQLTPSEERAMNIVGGPAQIQGQFNGGHGMPFLHRDFLAAYERIQVGERLLQGPGFDELRQLISGSDRKLCLPEQSSKEHWASIPQDGKKLIRSAFPKKSLDS